MVATSWIVVVLSVAAVFGLPRDPVHQLHEKRSLPSRAWTKRDRVSSDAILPMKIGLKQQNLHRGYDYLLDV